MADSTIRYIFIIMFVLVVVSYFVGAATETNSLANGILKLVLALTGRYPSGAPAGYPSGASTVQGG